MAMAKVPASVIVPLVVIGPPEKVSPVVPPETLTLVTVPVPADAQTKAVPDHCKYVLAVAGAATNPVALAAV